MMLPTLWAAEAPQYVGRIQGGWEYIWASYIITWSTLCVFASRLAALRMPQREQLFTGISWLLLTAGGAGLLTFAHAPRWYLIGLIVPLVGSVRSFLRYFSAPRRVS